MTYWKNQTFKELQDEWYQRLKDDGFDDAEESVGEEMRLKQNAEHAFAWVDEVEFVATEAYFNFVSQMVQVTPFRNDVDRIILESHAAGKKIKHICAELASIGKKRHRASIRYRIRVYEMKWGIRKYTRKQLNRRAS